jgi:hypothetical protein
LHDEAVLERRLPSGRSLVLRTDPAGEEIEIRGARGELDLRIVLTDTGPVVMLQGARLEVESPDVAFRCRTFAVKTSGDLRLESEAQVRIDADELVAKTEHDIKLNGAYIRLNCTPDEQRVASPPALANPSPASPASHALAHPVSAEPHEEKPEPR